MKASIPVGEEVARKGENQFWVANSEIASSCY